MITIKEQNLESRQENRGQIKREGRKRRWFIKLLTAIVILPSLALLAGSAYFYWVIIPAPNDDITPENIERLLAVESPVFYADDKEKIGVFFEDAHREYVQYEQIPKAFIKSLLAAEDHKFFEHPGVDVKGLLRALVANIRAGRIVQGGSTITQQAAKNLFKRKDRSLEAKFRELIYALRLERVYSKEKILEFYANQFFVSGNGHGLSMAARYYFDKKVEELDLLESAFIAGSLKKPNYYNPFVVRTEEGRQAALRYADGRAKFVLAQMLRFGMIGLEEYEQNRNRQIPFKQGRMSYSHDTVMDLVKAGLASPSVEEVLAERGIDNVATSGIRIFTTIKKTIQEQSVIALRKELSSLDVQLSGYDHDAVQEAYGKNDGGDAETHEGAFVFGRIAKMEKEPRPAVYVTFQSKGEVQADGVIDRAGFDHLLKPFVQHTRSKWTTGTDAELPSLLKQLKEGDKVFVHLRKYDSASGRYLLDLEKYPEIQGGAIVLEHGAIRAMVGGMENVFFNRAVMARRPMGSVMKPIVYSVAQQLGWNVVDLINNERSLFIYQNGAYFPRPDHESPFAEVSMTWAGALSENVATVWLLYHLCDHLSPAQFKMIAQNLDLGRRNDEPFQLFAARIRDKWGVLVNDTALYRAAFQQARKSVEPDLLFDGRGEEVRHLQTFQYSTENLIDRSEEKGEEADIRQALLSRSFQRYEELAGRCETALSGVLSEEAASSGDTLIYQHSEKPDTYAFWEGRAPAAWRPLTKDDLVDITQFMSDAARKHFFDGVLLNGWLRVGTVKLLAAAMEKEYKRLSILPPYADEVLHSLTDFRVLAGIKYLIEFCKAVGIASPLEPVLSFPLGSNVISLYEAVKAYEAITTGTVITWGDGVGPELHIIERIEDRDGEIIYQPNIVSKPVVPPQLSIMTNGILRNVMLHGTGKSADRKIRLHSNDPVKEKLLASFDLQMPLLGKTGTANRYTNSAFVGVLPGPAGRDISLSVEKGFTVGAYVGYDDNRPMVYKAHRISGALGALPIWTRIVDAIIREEDFAGGIDEVDLTFHGQKVLPLRIPEVGQKMILLDESRGGVPAGLTENRGGSGGRPTTFSFGEIDKAGAFVPDRMVVPFWQTALTQAASAAAQ